MTDIIDSETGLNAEQLKQLHSSDKNRNRYKQEQTNVWYIVNYVLYYLYYILVVYFITTRFRPYVMNSIHFYRNLVIFFILLTYPYIIYPIQFYLFRIGRYFFASFYSNVYTSGEW